MTRPTRRTVLIFACGIPLTLLLVSFDSSLWALTFPYGALVLLAATADALLTPPKRLVSVSVSVPERLHVGERGAVTVTITSIAARRTTRFELLCDLRGDVDPLATATAELRAESPARASLPVTARRRGRVFADRLWLRWRGPLGLIERSLTVPVDRAIDVVPNIRGLHSAALQFLSSEAIYGVKVQQQTGEGAEFDALREYQPGLDHRFIDWKHSARHRRLLCKEFRIERNHHVVMAFDTGYLMLEPIDGIPRLDHAINAGPSGFARIQRATAELDYHRDETNFTLALAELNVRLKRRALVILFTDFVDTVTAELMIDSMQRVANRHVVLFVTLRDPLLDRMVDAAPARFEDVAQAVIAHDFLRDRSIVLERLERLGVHCLDVPSRGLATGVINRYLRIKQRGLI
jgi:uncharacterized protein (DUF58 family)